MNALVVNVTLGHCGCGCGTEISGKKTFAQGHDAKLKSALITTAVEGGLVVLNSGGVRTEVEAVAYADQFGFAHQVRAAVGARKAKAQAKASAPAKPRKPRVITIKVGRWTYDRATINDDGDAVYVGKDGTSKVAPAGQFVVVA